MSIEQTVLYSATAIGALSVIYALGLVKWIVGRPAGDARMQEIAAAILQGAQAYLNRQYRTVAVVAVFAFLLLGFLLNWTVAAGFLVGAVLSAISGYIGMNISVRANVRTAEAAKSGMVPALNLAFRGGAVTGLMVVGLGLLGTTIFYWVTKDVAALVGLAFGGGV